MRRTVRTTSFASFAFFALASSATAQVNCSMAPYGAARANCYAQEAQIYRQQAQAYNGIARQQYQTYQQVGAGLRYVPTFGRYAAPAWNVPGYVYTYRYGRP